MSYKIVKKYRNSSTIVSNALCDYDDACQRCFELENNARENDEIENHSGSECPIFVVEIE
jgi:hypothetical protein